MNINERLQLWEHYSLDPQVKRTRFQHGENIQGEIMQCKHPCETS